MSDLRTKENQVMCSEFFIRTFDTVISCKVLLLWRCVFSRAFFFYFFFMKESSGLYSLTLWSWKQLIIQKTQELKSHFFQPARVSKIQLFSWKMYARTLKTRFFSRAECMWSSLSQITWVFTWKLQLCWLWLFWCLILCGAWSPFPLRQTRSLYNGVIDVA